MRRSSAVFSFIKSRSFCLPRSSSAATVALLSAVLLASVSNAGASIYAIADYSNDQNGWSLSGSITTNGTAEDITIADITKVDVVLTDGSTSYDLTIASITGSLYVSGGSLDLNLYAKLSLENTNVTVNYENHFPTAESLSSSYSAIGDSVSLWTLNLSGNIPSDVGTDVGTNPMVIGTISSSSPIPEPTTLTVWALLGAFGVGLCWRRKRAASEQTTRVV